LKFIFATTEIRKVPVTVLSRCQRFDLRRIGSDTMAPYLLSIASQENVEIDKAALAMIVRASEGSMRDALSLMDQAIAHCASETGKGEEKAITIEGESVRAMLGLADRGRIIDLFEHLMKGDVAQCLEELRAQYDVGAEPGVVLSDLADFIHFVTRLKYVPQAAEDPAISEAESKKGSEFAQSLSVRVLGRAWQILLKGIEEVTKSERPLMAADMVLVRLAHAASLPTPDEIIRSIENSRGENGGGPAIQADSTGTPTAPSPAPGARPSSVAAGITNPAQPTARASAANSPQLAVVSTQPQAQSIEVESPQITLTRFDELVFLAEDKRDLQIKTGLRRHVRLVNFENGRLEFSIAGNPPQNFIGDLQHKLKLWTGRRWNIVISREQGAPSLEEIDLAQEKSNFDSARSDPVVEAILARFPGSKVIDVRIREDVALETDQQSVADLETGGLDDFYE
jgi:DNA polymerase-3 subunit gamma/tau